MKPIRGGLLLGVVAGLGLLGVAPASCWAAYPGANGRIAYSGHAGPEGADYDHIFTVLPSGSGLEQLTDAEISDGQPSWSADGSRLTFVRPSYYTSQVFTMRADGSNVRRVTHDNGMDSSPNFSPSGGRIVYSKEVALFTIRTGGTDRRRIIHRRGSRLAVILPKRGANRLPGTSRWKEWVGQHLDHPSQRIAIATAYPSTAVWIWPLGPVS